MKLQLKCTRCGKTLGEYEGELFYVIWDAECGFYIAHRNVKILCKQCARVIPNRF